MKECGKTVYNTELVNFTALKMIQLPPRNGETERDGPGTKMGKLLAKHLSPRRKAG
jgi:hypothetical protein